MNGAPADSGARAFGTSGYAAAPAGGPRRASATFTVVVSVAMVLGATVMALVLLSSGAPRALAIGLVLAALPVGPLVATFVWLDRYEPEPATLLATAFGWGALVATAIALLLQAVDQVAFASTATVATAVVAPVTEEAAKGAFVVLLLVARRHELDGILDGIVYAGLVGVGFAFTENILYLAAAYMGTGAGGASGIEAATGTFIVRGLFSPFAHPLFTAATGIGVGVAVVTRSRTWRVLGPLLGYCAAVLGHALWNGSAFLAGGQLFVLTYVFAMVPAFGVLAGFAIWVRYREGQLLSRALGDLAGRGLVPVDEVPWLARLAGRRAARRTARRRGGPAAARVMADYQQAAIELGFLHDRVLHNRAPASAVARGQALVNRLSGLRPYALFPQLPAGRHVDWEGGR
jgi:RsiW-degrading membrane proteinase PrsW (M82 family)